MNAKVVLALLVLSLITIFALVCVLLSGGGRTAAPRRCPAAPAPPRPLPAGGSLFADLSPEELNQVLAFLARRLGPGLVDASEAGPADTCVYSVDLQLPPKAAALRHLDGGGPPPPREARAVVFFGRQPRANVSEFLVGPLPGPSYLRDVTAARYGGPLPYHRRPVLGAEFSQMWRHLREVELPRAPTLLAAIFGSGHPSFSAQGSAPRGLRSGDRATWFGLFHNVSGAGYFLHPVGLELLLDHADPDPARWAVRRVYFGGRYYPDLGQLERAFVAGRVEAGRVAAPPPGGGAASLRSRGPPGPTPPLQGPPGGPRYRVRGSQVATRSWTFSYGLGVSTGLRLLDVRFRGERVAYELSVQEALSVYGAGSPRAMTTRYLDGSYGLGRLSEGLVRGVDCPYTATFLDVHVLLGEGRARRLPGALCLFEEAPGRPLRRHLSRLHSDYYGGLGATALVVRAISAVGNYDYVWDWVLHPHGVMEGRVHATGYISTVFLGEPTGGLRFGNRVGENVLGPVHTHSFHFKLDLDVAGTENWVVAEDMAFEQIVVPWSPEYQLHRPWLTRETLETEEQASFPLGTRPPSYLYLASNRTNAWGHRRGYRIQTLSPSWDHLPQASSMERALSWARYQLAVTRRKEEEPASSSIYNQNDPWTPSVAFADFIDNETIMGEDLVAWVTAGFLHIPHAEDVPNTVTVGNGVGFFLRPYNYFDEDPSASSPDAVYFRGDQDASSCSVNPVACLAETAACVPDLPPFSYHGFRDP
ncbi:retina-specific copper amine oxidase-like [Tachyglossus aculeatus]|uniref:retina-specific copper amine oxidase-like n=1 Tax=Tachyglossus aculeatus TaxID=9261 RepID=UPI0018F7AA1D|nr:retina-specific copper amine oxidase-like [Tachyglossus aculeatus]